MNFFTTSKKNPEILRLYCTKSLTFGKPIQWNKKDDFTCDSVALKDDINIEVKESGWYQTNLKLVVKQYIHEKISEDLIYFLAAIQNNSEAISLYYSNINNSENITTVCLNDINYFNKGDIITVVLGMCNLLDLLEEKQNIFNIIKV